MPHHCVVRVRRWWWWCWWWCCPSSRRAHNTSPWRRARALSLIGDYCPTQLNYDHQLSISCREFSTGTVIVQTCYFSSIRQLFYFYFYYFYSKQSTLLQARSVFPWRTLLKIKKKLVNVRGKWFADWRAIKSFNGRQSRPVTPGTSSELEKKTVVL